MSRLMEYFNEVDKNAVMRAAHVSSPIESMEKFGLSADERQCLMSGDALQIAGAIGIDCVSLQTLYIPLELPVEKFGS